MPTPLASKTGQVIVKIKIGDLDVTADLARYDRARFDHTLDLWRVERHALKFNSLEAWRTAYDGLLRYNRQATVTVGVSQGGVVTWRPPETRYVAAAETDSVSTNASQYGPMVAMTLVDPLYRLAAAKRASAFSGSTEATTQALAAKYNLAVRLEPTVGRNVALIQSYQTDYEFFLQRVKPRMISVQGVVGYMVYCRADTMFVHTPAWAEARTWATQVGADTPVSDWSARDQLGKSRLGGRDGIDLLATDPLVGRNLQLRSDPGAAVRFSQASWPYLANQVVSAHVGVNGADDEQTLVQSQYAWARYEMAGAQLVVYNEPDVWVGDLVQVALPGRDPGQGTYLIKAISSELNEGNLRTQLTLIRGEVALPGQALGVNLPAPQSVQPNSRPVLPG